MEKLIERIKGEILADVRAGVVPESVRSFSELHDYVDANCYGGGCGMDVDGDEFQKFVDELNTAQSRIDFWIKNGGVSGTMSIKKGDALRIKKEFQDEGDEKFAWIALEDEDGGRVLVGVLNTGMRLMPTEIIQTRMLERV